MSSTLQWHPNQNARSPAGTQSWRPMGFGARWVVALLALALALALASALSSVARVFADDPPPPGVAVETRIDREVITVGDRIQVTVLVRAAPGMALQAPQGEEALGRFEVLERRGGTVQRTPDGGQLLRLEYIVTAFEPGLLVLTGVEIGVAGVDGVRQTVHAPDARVTVRSVLEQDPNPQLLDLKPPLTLPGGPLDYTRPVAQALLVAATLALAVVVIRRLPRRRPSLVALAATSPQDVARHELAAIIAERLMEQGHYEAFYRRLALCIRRYLEEQYGLPALSCTTTELDRAMAQRGTDRWLARVVIGLLDECDSVRWAGYLPADARAERALELALAVVDLETPAPVGVS
ncbi:MAG: hypothetical protein HY689_08560 [Chloroflexi bacterium]|nr:hypothetical protein [Chloroflexota bacterium]